MTSDMMDVFVLLVSLWLLAAFILVLWTMRTGAMAIGISSALVGVLGLGIGTWLGNWLAPCYECIGPSDGGFIGGIIGLFTGWLVGGVAAWVMRRP